MNALTPGLKFEATHEVNDANAINFLGDGGPRVLATPALIMYLEMACRDLAKERLDAGFDSVGTHVDVKHLAATPIGMRVTCHSELLEVQDRRLRFRVEAFDAKEKVAEGFHERAVINVAKFAARIAAKRPE